MGLLDSVIEAIGHGQDRPQEGTQPNWMVAMMALLEATGGLRGLMNKLEAGGLGDIARSWISAGANLPVSAAQLNDALGPDAVAEVSQHLAMKPADAMTELSKWLPQIVDRLTPQGELPAGSSEGGLASLAGPGTLGDLGGMLDDLLKR